MSHSLMSLTPDHHDSHLCFALPSQCSSALPQSTLPRRHWNRSFLGMELMITADMDTGMESIREEMRGHSLSSSCFSLLLQVPSLAHSCGITAGSSTVSFTNA